MVIKAPMYEPNQVLPGVAPSAGVPVNVPNLGGAAGAAAQVAGGAILDVEESRARAAQAAVASGKRIADDLAVLSASEELERAYMETLDAPQTGLRTLEGRALLDGYGPALEGFGRRASEIEAKLTPDQRLAFAAKSSAKRTALEGEAMRHFAAGVERYDDAVTARALATLQGSAASGLMAGDTTALDRVMAEQDEVLAGKYERNAYRLDPVARAAESEAEATKAIGAAIEAALATGDDELAAAVFADYGGRMAPDARARAGADVAKAVRIGTVAREADRIVADALDAEGDVTLAERESEALANVALLGEDVRDDVRAKVKTRFDEERTGRAQLATDAHAEVDRLWQSGVPVETLQMSPLWNRQTPDAQRAVLKLDADRRKGLLEPAAPDPAVYLGIVAQYADPATRGEFAKRDLLTDYPSLSPEQRREVSGWQESLRNGGAPVEADRVQTTLQIANAAGVLLEQQYGSASKEDASRITVELLEQIRRERQAAVAAGKPWGEADDIAVRDRFLGQVVYDDSDSKPAFLLEPGDVGLEDIPADELDFIRGALGANASDDEIAEAWINLLRYNQIRAPWASSP